MFKADSIRRFASVVVGAGIIAFAFAPKGISQITNPGVQQSGSVTSGHFASWGPGVGQIQDGGAIPGTFVSSFNGRSGAVVPVANDYDFSLIGPSLLGCSQLPVFTGDMTNSLCAMTLASVITAGGPTGSATVAPIITYDANGRLTAVSSATITPAASSITSGAALTKTDDTNVTLTLGGTPASALLKAASLTVGWTGQLAFSRGGCNGTTQQSCFDNAAPTATVAGSLIYWNGTHWVKLDGNASGTKVLQEDNAGNPSWVSAGSGTVTSAIIAGTANDIAVSGTCTITTTGTCTIDLASGRKTLSTGCAILATATTTCADGSAGANNGTYTTPTGALWLEIEMVGGGVGGSGSGTGAGAGGAGGNTTFGTSLLTASGGAAGSATSPGSGGSATGGYVNRSGGVGGNGASGIAAAVGGMSCSTPYGGGGAPGNFDGGVGRAAAANTGSGGGGAGAAGTPSSGSGGSCGGYLRAIIGTPSATYAYAIGAAGAAGTAGTGGNVGGAGGTGYINIIPHFN